MMRPSVLLALALGLAACGPPGAQPDDPFDPVAAEALSHMNLGTVRRWTDFYGTQPMSITEQVIQLTDGQWSDELLTLNGKTPAQLTTAEEVKAFTDLSRMLDGGRGRYHVSNRDFRIRDWSAFQANYDWNLISTTDVVAGRPAFHADVWPVSNDRPRYTVWVDQATLLTLKVLEFLPTGELASEMEVLSIDWDPDLDGITLQPAQQSTLVDPHQFPALVSFKTFALQYVPAGFALVATKLGSLGQGPALTQQYSDGVVELLFAQYAELTPTTLQPGADPNAPVSVHSNFWGPFARTHFSIVGTQMHVHTKLAKDELMNVIESIAPNP